MDTVRMPVASNLLAAEHLLLSNEEIVYRTYPVAGECRQIQKSRMLQ